MQGTYCIIKEKNYMIIPIDAEKPPDQMPRAFMIKKNSQQIGYRRSVARHNKSHI